MRLSQLDGEQSRIDGGQYRALMSNWATGVGVVTTTGQNGPVGCTVTSVASVSLDPPLLLVCLTLGTRILAAVEESQRFCVNMLSADQKELSGVFAAPASQAERFAGVPYELVHGVPVLLGCVAYAFCELEGETRAADHAIVVGRPTLLGVDPGRSPLVLFRRRRWTLPVHGLAGDIG